MTDQPVFEARYAEHHSRLTTFFRYILAIPHFIVLSVWGLVAGLAVIAAWFAVVFTGRYPQGLYDFAGAFIRYATAVYGYTTLLTDDYPPFSGDTAGYPVQLRIPPPKPEYSRLKAALRILLAIPVLIILYAMQVVYSVGSFIAWFAIVILGRLPKGLHDMIVLGLSYQQRAYPYLALMTEDWPPFIDQQGALGGGPDDALPPAPSAYAAPEAPGRISSAPPPAPPPQAPPGDGGGVSSGDPLQGP